MMIPETLFFSSFSDKEEILTISSSSPLDEHTDSGIENNRSNSNLQSPSTSLDFSPRSDSRQSGYQSGSFSPRYFIRATSPSPIGAVPLTPPPPLPNAAETVNVLRKSVELEDVTAPSLVGTLLQIDTNKDIRRNKDTKIDQTVIGYGLTKKSYGSDYSSIGGRTPYSDSENEFLTPVSTEFTKDESEILKYDRATPADSRVDSALPEQDYDSTLSESNSGTLEALERLAVQSPEHSTSDVVDSRCSSDDNKQQSGKKIKGISLGVELQREQSANITAVKFPLKKQNYAAEKTFRTQRYSLSATEPSDTDLTPSSTVSSTENTSSSEIRESAKVVAKKEAEETMKNSVGAFADKTNALKNVVEANKDGIITMNIDLGYQSKNSRKYFGFVVGGGKDKEVPPFVENVIPGTPAEDAGLKIGDVILSINGELVEGRYHQTIMRMLREAGVLGEVELQIVRPEENQSLKSGSFPYVSDKSGTNSFRKFDEKRAKFDEKTTESTVAYKVQQFKKQCQTSKWCSQRENLEKSKQIKTPPPTPPKTVALHRVVEEPAPTLQTQCAPEARQMPTVIASTSIPRCSLDSDYRVTSFDEKPGPGKLADFIPEVERGKLNNNVRGKSAANDSTCSSLRRETDVEEPKVLRNFDVSPTKSIPITIVPAVTKSKRESERNGEMENNLKAQMPKAEGAGKYWKGFPKTIEYIDEQDVEYKIVNYENEIRKKEIKKSVSSTGDDKRVTFGASEIHEITPRQTQEIVFPITSSTDNYEQSDALLREDYIPQQKYYAKNSIAATSMSEPTVSQPPTERIHPIKLSGQPDPEGRTLLDSSEIGTVPATYHSNSPSVCRRCNASTALRSCSCDDLYSTIRKQQSYQQQYYESPEIQWNGCRSVPVIPKKYPVDYSVMSSSLSSITSPKNNTNISHRQQKLSKRFISRSMSPIMQSKESNSSAISFDDAKKFGAPELVESADSREWRHYIEEQRYPSGTKSATDDGERCHSLNSPTNEACSSLPNSKKHQSSSHCHLPPVGITEATRLNKVDVSSSAASPVVERRPKIYHYTQTHTQQFKRSGLYNTGLSSSPINERGKKGISGWSDENMAQQEPILSVSGKHRCSHCQMELGRGAAMIIESLNLFYHLSCFRCYVCNAALSNGAQGADVRVRDSKLHCQNCYHNEEAGLKYSQV